MTRSNREIDDLIRAALEQADAETFDDFGTQSMAERLAETFGGRNRRWAIGGAVANLVLLATVIMSAVRFVRADDERTMLLWGGAMLLGFVAVTAIKIWYWLEMNRLALTREVKRVELHVVQLAQRLEDRQGE